MMRFNRKFKIALIAALGVMLLASIAGAAVFALTALQDTTEDTPAAIVGETAGSAVGPVTAMGEAAPSPLEPEPAEASAAPSPPASVSGTRSADGSGIAATWSSVSDATHYNLNYTNDNGQNWHRYATDTPNTSVAMTGLQHTKGYTLAVQSVKKESGQSYASGWTDSVLIAGAPAAVASVTGARSENGKEIAVSWSAVSDATHYNLNYTNDGGASWNRYKSDIPTPSVTFKMTGLENRKAYILAVQSVRKAGDVKFAYGWKDSAKVHAPPSKPRSLSRTKHYSSYGSLSGITIEWTIPEFTGTGANSSATKIGFNISCYLNGSWTRMETNKKFTPDSDNKYSYWTNTYPCVQADAIGGIAAVNEVTGEAETLTLLP